MGLFGKKNKGPQPATAEDAKLLRDSLVLMLKELERKADQPDTEGVEELIKRLGRFPSPTGVKRELLRLIPSLVDGEDVGTPFGEAALAMGQTMEVIAFADPELEESLDEFRGEIPDWVDPPRARRLRRDARRLADKARPLRNRMLAARKQTRELVVQLAGRLGDSSGAAGRVDRVLSELETAISTNDAARLEALRPTLLDQVVAAREDTRELRENLDAALMEVQALRGTVDAQADALSQARRELARDPLTGVANRRALDGELPRMVAEAHAGGSLALLALDIDHFKSVNDTYGHAAGDVVLRSVAQKVMDLLRGEDLMARAGGEEFVVLLPGSNPAGAMQVAERIREGVAGLNFTQEGKAFKVTISIGVAMLRRDESGETLWARADAALYDAKHGGRDQAVAA
ncbi:MAG: GGDEF domain-containing protein [Myxococcota bacterium]|nr:GGDEF domain-containing protein [Myxococcota bacterium]